MIVDQLMLETNARQAAQALLAAFPAVVFTSGRRDVWQQAHAMACNEVQAPGFIVRTYIRAASFATWMDLHPEAKTIEQKALGFYQLLTMMSPDEQTAVSRHLGGEAFDVAPLWDSNGLPWNSDGAALIVAIQDVCDRFGGSYLLQEGGLPKGHLQFHERVEVYGA